MMNPRPRQPNRSPAGIGSGHSIGSGKARVVTGITEHLGHLQGRIAQAAIASGRTADAVTLVGVSKGQPIEAVREARALGLCHFGENYIQEALSKIRQVDENCTWHFIGRLQSNKTRLAAERFAWVQTVATSRIAERLSAQRPYYAPPLQVCIQVQAEGAAVRGGCAGADLLQLAGVIAGLPRLALRGLMYVPAPGLDADELRRQYRKVKGQLDVLQHAGHGVDTLSMGMSDDYTLAIAEGSTMVRIGSTLFGPRAPLACRPEEQTDG